MRASIVSSVLVLAGLGASFAFMSTVVTTSAGCDPVDGGQSSSGNADGGEGGTASTADAGLVWGCSDNGTQCNCYSPAPSEYTQAACIPYSCCVATTNGLGQHGCQCTNDTPCASSDPSAVRVKSCP